MVSYAERLKKQLEQIPEFKQQRIFEAGVEAGIGLWDRVKTVEDLEIFLKGVKFGAVEKYES